MATNPTLITTPFAQSGDKTTPPNTNTPSDGRFSQTLGFPPVTAIPLGSGGKAPKREDFNGALNMLANIAFYAQKGFTFNWDSGQAYYVGCRVIDSNDGNMYVCISDVAAGQTRPMNNTTKWKKADMTGGSGGFSARDVLTTSGTYTAPQDGTYMIICIGGGGAGGNGGVSSYGGLSGTAGGTTTFGSYCSASGGASGAGGGQRSSGGGGAAGSVEYAFATLTSGQSISYTIGAGGTAASSGTSSGTTGANGSGGASGGVAYSTAEGGRSNYGSGGAGARYDAGSSTVYYGSQPMGYGGTNGTPYGGGGGGGVTNYCDHVPVCGASGGANGSNGATIYTKDSTYPQGGNGGAGAIILYY